MSFAKEGGATQRFKGVAILVVAVLVVGVGRH